MLANVKRAQVAISLRSSDPLVSCHRYNFEQQIVGAAKIGWSLAV